MPQVASIDGLTPQQRQFAEEFAKGFTQTQAAARAGYDNPSSSGRDQIANPKVRALVDSLRQTHQAIAQYTREEFIGGLKEAIDMARLMSDPQTMIVGIRELGRACGYYEPQKVEIKHSVEGRVLLERLNTMSDQELLELVNEPKVIEGEIVEEEEQP
jgi:hypothetical protein